MQYWKQNQLLSCDWSNIITKMASFLLYTRRMLHRTTALGLLGISVLAAKGYGSLFNPHVFPTQAKDPFFEGWYFRLVDFSRAEAKSFAVLFGSVHPSSAAKADHLAYVGFLEQVDEDSFTKKNALTRLQSYNAFPAISSVSVTANGGQPVTRDPSVGGNPDFEWKVANGYCVAKDNETSFNFKIGNVTFSAEVEHDWPWSRSGEGPEGFLTHFPLPLSWYVHSRGSKVKRYSWENHATGEKFEGSEQVYAHMEKNWGPSFPSAWIWMQGVNPDENSSFAFSYGPIDFFGIIPVTGYLGGYENKNKGIHQDFLPFPAQPSHISIDFDGCHGYVNMTLWRPTVKLQLRINAPMKTFSKRLYAPEESGFRRACTESYEAAAQLTIFHRNLFGRWKVVDEMKFEKAALEFGGNYTCHVVPSGHVHDEGSK